MPAPYSASAQLRGAPLTLPTSDPKDLATWRGLLDAYQHQLLSTWNRVAWSGDFSVDPGGSSSSFAVNVGAIYGVSLYDVATNTYPHLSAAATAIGASKIEGGGNLANDSWYFAYAWSNASSIDYELSLTGPSASRVRKSGNADADRARVYLGCFRTGSAGAPLPVTAVRGRYLYRRSAIASVDGAFAANGLRAVAAGGGAVALTALDLSARVPPHALRAALYGEAVVTSSAGTATTTLALYDAADTTSPSQEIAASVIATGDTGRNSARAEVQLTGAQLCGYAVVGTSDVHSATVDVMGWEE